MGKKYIEYTKVSGSKRLYAPTDLLDDSEIGGGSGGGADFSSLKSFTYKIADITDTHTITHDLGRVPSFIFIASTGRSVTGSSNSDIGVLGSVLLLNGTVYITYGAPYFSSTYIFAETVDNVDVTSTTYGAGIFFNATETTFDVNMDSYPFKLEWNQEYVVIVG